MNNRKILYKRFPLVVSVNYCIEFLLNKGETLEVSDFKEKSEIDLTPSVSTIAIREY